MWLEARTRAAITSWEKIILDEIFLFCGGQEGSWSNDDGWTDNGDGRNGAAASSSSFTHSEIDRSLTLGQTDPGRGCHLEQRRAGVVMRDGRVAAIRLQCNGLRGVLPPSFGLLAALRALDLSGNILKGRNISCLCSLKSVEVVNLASNFLEGSIPREIGSLRNLKHLFLSDNKLTGRIPTSLSSLQQLVVLCLDGNSLTGRLPPGLANLRKLSVLALQGNKLEGCIPDLTQLSKLRTVELSWNNINNGLSSLATLTSLRALTWRGPGGGRGISGELQTLLPSKPPDFTGDQYMQLVRLDLTSHALRGELPAGIRALPCLEGLFLRENALCGRLPDWLGELTLLRHVDLAENSFEGTVPQRLEELRRLEVLLLHRNKLDGILPPGVLALVNGGQVRQFSFYGNQTHEDTLPTCGDLLPAGA